MIMKYKYRVVSFVIVCFFVLSYFGAYAKREYVPYEEYQKLVQNFTPLDISKAANMGFADAVEGDGKGGWTDQGAINDLRSFDLKGINRLMGIDFNIINPEDNDGKSCIVLRGQNNENFPKSVEIPVNAKGEGVYFLHATAWMNKDIGRYKFIYDDDTEGVVNIVGNVDVFDWWGTGSSETAMTAWTGSNASTGAVSLYAYACENPYPNKLIKKIIAETDGDKAYLMIVAATLTDSGPYIQKPQDKGNPDTSDWYPYEYMMDAAYSKGSPLDVSFVLDPPAGKHGYIKPNGEGFIFEDGTNARFWGINIDPSGAFVSYQDAEEFAERLAQNGFNLVRFHALDANYLYTGGLFKKTKNSRELNPKNLDRFCYLINELKKKGIYHFIDVTCYIDVREDDNIQDPDALKFGLKGAEFYARDLIDIQKNVTEKLFSYYNPYTGMKIGEDPALVFVAFNNESSPLHIDIMNSGYYNEVLQKKFSKWLLNKYRTRDDLEKAWEGETGKGLEEDEDPAAGTVKAPAYKERANLTRNRRADTIQFLIDVQNEYYEERVEQLRELGVKCAVTCTTSWGNDELAIMYSNANTDFIDTHQYWSHPTGGNALKPPVRLTYNKPVSMLSDSNMGAMGYLLNRRVFGMPLTTTEWNTVLPNPHVSEGLLLVSSYYSFNGWIPMYYTWNSTANFEARRRDLEKGIEMKIGMVFAAATQPDVLSALPAAALIYMREDVKEAETGFYHRYSESDGYNPSKQNISRNPAWALIGKTGISIENKEYDPDYNNNDILYLANKAKENEEPYVSITGDMSTDFKQQLFKLNTERTQAFTGFAKDIVLNFDDIDIKIGNEYATVYLNSLSYEPIWNSEKLLLTTPGKTWCSGQKLSADGTAVLVEGTAPVLVEPIVGEFILKTKDDMEVFALNSYGQRTKQIQVEKTGEGYSRFVLEKGNKSMNYEIVRVKKHKGNRGPNERISLGNTEVKDLFTDMQDYEWAKKQVERLVLQKHMRGTSEDRFNPAMEITRRDFVTTIIKAMGSKEKSTTDFADVTKTDPGYEQISAARALGILDVNEQNTFNPDTVINRKDAMTFIERAIKIMGKELNVEDLFDFSAYEGKIELKPTLTRVETAIIIYRILWE